MEDLHDYKVLTDYITQGEVNSSSIQKAAECLAKLHQLAQDGVHQTQMMEFQ